MQCKESAAGEEVGPADETEDEHKHKQKQKQRQKQRHRHTGAAVLLELLEKHVDELLVGLRVEDLVVARVTLRPIQECDQLLGAQRAAVLRAARNETRRNARRRINESCFRPDKTI